MERTSAKSNPLTNNFNRAFKKLERQSITREPQMVMTMFMERLVSKVLNRKIRLKESSERLTHPMKQSLKKKNNIRSQHMICVQMLSKYI